MVASDNDPYPDYSLPDGSDRIRAGDTRPCGDAQDHNRHLWVPESRRFPIACFGVPPQPWIQ